MNPILAAQIISILAALMFSVGNVTLRYGLRTSTPITSTLALAVVTLAIFAPIALATSPKAGFSYQGLLILVAAGIASPGLSRTLLTMSFERIGLSRSVTISNAAPLIAVILAVIFLGERPAFPVYLGTLLIMAGVTCLTSEHRSAVQNKSNGKSVWHYFVLALLATLTLGIAATLRKIGITLIPSLSTGLSMAAIGTLLVTSLWYPLLPQEHRIRLNRQGVGYFLASAFFTCLAQLGFFAALQRAPLSIVIPLICTVPLFTLVFSWFFFREVERLNFRMVIGVLLISSGAALVTMS